MFRILRTIAPELMRYVLQVSVACLLIYLTYQTFLHPLSKYPGPFLARYSNAYSGYYAYKHYLHLIIKECHAEYGPVVRLGPNKLVFSSATALKDIYKSDHLQKPSCYMAMSPGLDAANIFTASDQKFHRMRRQLIGRILTDKSLSQFEPKVAGQIDLFLRHLALASQGSDPGPVNMSDRTRRLTVDLASLLGFGNDMGLQTSEDNDFMMTVFNLGAPLSNLLYHFYAIWPLVHGLFILTFFRIRERFLGLIDSMIKSRMKKDKNAIHDLYSVVADVLDAESGGLRQSDLWTEAFLFLTAAGETSRTAISALFFYLSRNHESYERLALEIRSTFGSGGDITSSALKRCHFLRACIDEALRLSPPVPGVLWREKADDNELQLVIDGHLIPRGTLVGLSSYTLHHDEQTFPEPFSFIPDRWLEPSTSDRACLARDSFAPFSLGPRACAGRSMAYMEISLTVAKTILYFDFEPASGSFGETGAGHPGLGLGRERPGEFQLHDIFTSLHDGPYLIFQPRGDLCKELLTPHT